MHQNGGKQAQEKAQVKQFARIIWQFWRKNEHIFLFPCMLPFWKTYDEWVAIGVLRSGNELGN